MSEYIFDGKPHVLSEEDGYISRKIEQNSTLEDFEGMKSQMIEEFVKYLIASDPKKCIDILKFHFLYNDTKDYQLIYRPPWIVGALRQIGIVSIKFKRCEKDCLGGEDPAE